VLAAIMIALASKLLSAGTQHWPIGGCHNLMAVFVLANCWPTVIASHDGFAAGYLVMAHHCWEL